jgi:predicted metal-dependent HD superfamily phosphohydrolase
MGWSIIFTPMFEQAFKTTVATVTDNSTLTDELWREIGDQYSGSGRHYHNLSHLDKLLQELDAVKAFFSDWQTILFAIAYHDIIYNPLKSDNEEKSASLATKRLSKLSIPAAQCDKCYDHIMATKGHHVAADNDTNFFTDADLAILGADAATYRWYAAMIRKEYHWYPDIVYKPGRKKVLQHFLDMPAIYKTAYFSGKYEKQARANLTSELNELK